MAAVSKKPTKNPDELADLRKRIDEINLKMVKLLSERAKVAQAIGHLKQADGAPIYQPAREREVIRYPLPSRKRGEVGGGQRTALQNLLDSGLRRNDDLKVIASSSQGDDQQSSRRV